MTAALVALFGGIFGFLVAVVGLLLLVFGADGKLMWDTALGLALFFVGTTVVGRALAVMGVGL